MQSHLKMCCEVRREKHLSSRRFRVFFLLTTRFLSISNSQSSTLISKISLVMNPYAFNWPNPANPNAVGRGSYDVQLHYPTYGALPANTAVPSPDSMTFRFNGPDTLNCVVVGSQNEPIVRISTSMGHQRVTTFTSANGVFASVEWTLQPLVTVANFVPRQEAMKWLVSSADGRSAGMTIGHDMYVWMFQGQSINVRLLFSFSSMRSLTSSIVA